jgi:hypothetical protein
MIMTAASAGRESVKVSITDDVRPRARVDGVMDFPKRSNVRFAERRGTHPGMLNQPMTAIEGFTAPATLPPKAAHDIIQNKTSCVYLALTCRLIRSGPGCAVCPKSLSRPVCNPQEKNSERKQDPKRAPAVFVAIDMELQGESEWSISQAPNPPQPLGYSDLMSRSSLNRSHPTRCST